VPKILLLKNQQQLLRKYLLMPLKQVLLLDKLERNQLLMLPLFQLVMPLLKNQLKNQLPNQLPKQMPNQLPKQMPNQLPNELKDEINNKYGISYEKF